MTKGIVRCIKIVHPLDKIRLYRILSAFFRFIGIFVCENITGQEYGGKTDWRYEVEPDSEDLSEPGAPLEKKIYDVLQDMKDLFGTDVLGVLDQIADIFIRFDLMRCSYALEYFGDVGKEYIYQEMKKGMAQFEIALKELEALEAQYGEAHVGSIYIWAAKSNCRRRENEIRAIIWNSIQSGLYGSTAKEKEYLKQELWERHFYSFEEISRDIVKILRKVPEFYGAHAIRGFSMEVDDDYRIDSFAEMERAAETIGEKSFASYVYYRMGRYYEKIRHDLPKKIDYYKKAYEIDSHNYRAIHKLVVYTFMEKQYGDMISKEKRYEETIRLLENLRNILEDRRSMPSLQPVECAYLYKTYSNMGKAYIRLGEYDKAWDYLKKAENVYNNSENEDRKKGFYPWMFGDESVISEGQEVARWQVYKSAAREKLKIKDVYTDIMNIAIRKGWDEEYRKYSSKMQEKRILVENSDKI